MVSCKNSRPVGCPPASYAKQIFSSVALDSRAMHRHSPAEQQLYQIMAHIIAASIWTTHAVQEIHICKGPLAEPKQAHLACTH